MDFYEGSSFGHLLTEGKTFSFYRVITGPSLWMDNAHIRGFPVPLYINGDGDETFSTSVARSRATTVALSASSRFLPSSSLASGKLRHHIFSIRKFFKVKSSSHAELWESILARCDYISRWRRDNRSYFSNLAQKSWPSRRYKKQQYIQIPSWTNKTECWFLQAFDPTVWGSQCTLRKIPQHFCICEI